LISNDDPNPIQTLKDRFQYDLVPLVEEYCYSNRAAMQLVFGQLVSHDGSINAAMLDDDEDFLTCLGELIAKKADQ
jgi:hypothetical protein